MKSKKKTKAGLLSGMIVLIICAVVWVLPILLVFLNSFKQNTFVKTDTFGLQIRSKPDEEIHNRNIEL